MICCHHIMAVMSAESHRGTFYCEMKKISPAAAQIGTGKDCGALAAIKRYMRF
jgi:hypothetical protein